jgi:transposase-like protein
MSNTIQCPKCNSFRTEIVTGKIVGQRLVVCNSCGNSWEIIPGRTSEKDEPEDEGKSGFIDPIDKAE